MAEIKIVPLADLPSNLQFLAADGQDVEVVEEIIHHDDHNDHHSDHHDDHSDHHHHR